MRVTTLQWHGNFKIEVSDTEMSALRKIVEAGLFALEGEEDDGMTTSERKAMAYWKGQNPLNMVDGVDKPYRRPRTGAKAKEAVG